jgi:glutaredoxin
VGPVLQHLQVILYSRQGCHLCDTAHECLAREQKEYQFALIVTDVDTEAKLVELYGDQVPVVTVNGKVRFRGAVNPVLLKRLLLAEAEGQSNGADAADS